MPGYAGSGQAALLRENRQAFLFQQEKDVAGRASVAFQLERTMRTLYQSGVSFQLYFTDINGVPTNPGAFEIDIQSSDIDQDIQYCTASPLTGGASLNANFVQRVEIPTLNAKYIRAFIISITNPVYISLLAGH